jgi:hypothetical protein
MRGHPWHDDTFLVCFYFSEAGGLPDCVSQGRTILKKISAAAEHITDEVTVNLFADAVLLKEQKLDLPEQKTKISEARLQWTGYVKSLTETNEFQPTVTVIVSQSEEKVQCLYNFNL